MDARELLDHRVKAQAEDVNAGKAEGDAKDAAEGEKGAKQTLKDN